MLQRNGPSAYQHVISALEGRRLQQEDEGLQPTCKPLYKVTGIKMLLASVRNELRLAKSKVPGKTSVMSWSQVALFCLRMRTPIFTSQRQTFAQAYGLRYVG